MRKNGKLGRKRGNHCGTIVKKGNGWMARWFVMDQTRFLKDKDGGPLFDKNGLPKHPKVRISKMLKGATTIAEAREQLDELTREYNLDQPKGLLERLGMLVADQKMREKELEEKRAKAEDAKPGLLLKDFFEAFKNSSRRSNPSDITLDSYHSHCKHFLKWMTSHHPDVAEARHVTPAFAEEYATHLRNAFSPETHNKKIVFLRSCWKTLTTVENSKIKINPWEGIHNLRTDSQRRKVLTVEELVRIARVLPPDYLLLMAIGLYTGLRIEDCAQLRWEDVDLHKARIITEPRKTKYLRNREVLLPIHPVLFRLLSAIPTKKHVGPIIPSIDRKFKLASRGSTVSRKFGQYLKSVGIETSVKIKKEQRSRPKATFHSLRHTFTSWIANKGGDHVLLQKMLGHKETSMTDHYIHEALPILFEMVSAIPVIPGILPDDDSHNDIIDVTEASSVITTPKTEDELTKRLLCFPERERRKWQTRLLSMLPDPNKK